MKITSTVYFQTELKAVYDVIDICFYGVFFPLEGIPWVLKHYCIVEERRQHHEVHGHVSEQTKNGQQPYSDIIAHKRCTYAIIP